MRGGAALETIRAGMAGGAPEATAWLGDDSLRALAPHLFLLEMARDQPIYRLAGGAVQSVLGADPRGRCYYDDWQGDTHPTLRSFFQTAIQARCPFHILSDTVCRGGMAARGETVLIPIALPDSMYFVGVSILFDGDADMVRPATPQRLRRIAFL